MRYVSTRCPAGIQYSFTDILLAGLAPDGGLFLPVSYPKVDAKVLRRWAKLLETEGYAALAAEIMGLYVDDIPTEDLRQLCARAYRIPVFSCEQIVPVERVEAGNWLVKLSQGPTAAFKDMAMQMLGQLFEYELGRRGRTMTIVGATSGDTGSSAEYAMLGRAGINVFMLTPAGRMTPFQQAQMFSITDPAITNIAIDGVFDDCQDIVKAINADADFKSKYSVGAVNSINWARLLAQVVYYVAAWARITGGDVERKVSFSVPTGNFGDICAGHVARQMGVPVDKLILATNENNVLEEFFNTGCYRVRSGAQTLATSSPSMDISKASNFERFVADLLGRDALEVARLFGSEIGEHGGFDLSGSRDFARIKTDYGFVAGASTHKDRVATIGQVFEKFGVVIDPHTADAWCTAQRLREAGVVSGEIGILETALPVKFGEIILEATGRKAPVPARFDDIEGGVRKVVSLPNQVQAVKDLIVATLQ